MSAKGKFIRAFVSAPSATRQPDFTLFGIPVYLNAGLLDNEAFYYQRVADPYDENVAPEATVVEVAGLTSGVKRTISKREFLQWMAEIRQAVSNG